MLYSCNIIRVSNWNSIARKSQGAEWSDIALQLYFLSTLQFIPWSQDLLDVKFIFFSFILEENWQNPDIFCFRICTDGSSRSTTIPLKPLSHHDNVVFLAAQFIVFDTDNLKCFPSVDISNLLL